MIKVVFMLLWNIFHNMSEYQRTVEKMKDLRKDILRLNYPRNDGIIYATYDVYNGCHGD